MYARLERYERTSKAIDTYGYPIVGFADRTNGGFYKSIGCGYDLEGDALSKFINKNVPQPILKNAYNEGILGVQLSTKGYITHGIIGRDRMEQLLEYCGYKVEREIKNGYLSTLIISKED